MLRKLSGILLFLALGCGVAFAQSTLKGTVKDAGGAPLAGAMVMIQGTTTGTVTDLDGNYSITVPSQGGGKDRVFQSWVFFTGIRV